MPCAAGIHAPSVPLQVVFFRIQLNIQVMCSSVVIFRSLCAIAIAIVAASTIMTVAMALLLVRALVLVT